MLNDHLFIVFAIDHYNPLGIVRSLGEKGIMPVYIGIRGKVVLTSKSKYISHFHPVDTVEEGYALLLSEYGNFDEAHRPFVLCSDDRTQGYLDSRYDELKDRFILFNADGNDRVNQYIDKEKILELAHECGLVSADTVVCDCGQVPENIRYPVITKSISPNVGGWKSDVFICRSEDELRQAYGKIRAPRVLVQSYIEKKNELEYYGFSIDHGKDVFFSIAADYLYLIPGYYSPYMNVFEPPYPEVRKKIADMIRKVGFEGIFSVEFLVTEEDELLFLEINFRNATWSYASTCAGMNLPYLWAESMLSGKIPERAAFAPFRAMVEPIDYGKRVEDGKISLAGWLKDFRECQCTYYYNANDPAPYETLLIDWDKLK